MAGVLALLVAEREDRLNSSDSPRKTEIILGTAGVGIATIALLTGKSYDAVQKAIERAKGNSRSKPVTGERG
jgi:hypothetical protein